MKNFYEILEISDLATQQEIKKAYVKLLRKYPPEKNPEEYKVIREAYDILKDDESKKNYDISLKCGGEIEELENNGKKHLENENYDDAIKCFEKILEFNSELGTIRNSLGNAYMLKRKYKKASLEYMILADNYPDNMNYICNLGFSFEMMGKIDKAEKLYLKAYEFDKTDKEVMGWLISLYWKQKRYFEVEKLLKKDIMNDGEVDFNDYYCYSKLIETYIRMDDTYKIVDLVKDIKKIIPNDPQIRENVIWDFTRLGILLSEAQRYEFAEILYKIAKTLCLDENCELNERIKIATLYKLTDNLLNDDKVEGILKGPLVYYMHGNEDTKKDRKNNLDNILRHLEIYSGECGEIIKASLDRIKKYYRELYEEVQDIYSEIEKLNRIQLKVAEEFKTFFSHSGISRGLKMCIASLVDKNDDSLKDGLNQLNKERKNEIRDGIFLIKRNYPNIYKVTSTFIEKVVEIVS